MVIHTHPKRISDLVYLNQKGFAVTCQTYFEIVRLDVDNSENSSKAFIFLCRYGGTVNGETYGFRKCYARSCSDHQCSNIYQAVMTAKSYANADYDKLGQAGIVLEKRRMTLEEIVRKFERMQEQYGPTQIIHDYIDWAHQGLDIRIDSVLNFISAQEHIADYTVQMIFLMVTFSVSSQGKTYQHERCFACYPKEKEGLEKQEKMDIANERLKVLYDEFDQALITYEGHFF
ncbi:MAG: hypothetical protein QNK25_13440 [Desulfobacterales bacterium]|nr:hypothetical protein [Desulfobacterales bacterium]